MKVRSYLSLPQLLAFLLIGSSDGFVIQHPIRTTSKGVTEQISNDAFNIGSVPVDRIRRSTTISTSLNAQQRKQQFTAAQRSRRKTLLSRKGPHFKLERFSGDVEFGSTAKLVTKLHTQPNPDAIAKWLSDGRGLALSIWDEKLLTDLGNSVYRLQTMKLQFVTIQLSPSVDVQMWTEQSTTSSSSEPVFYLQSVSYDPNIQLLPGVGISASSLGIKIEVVGELRPSRDGKGVTGTISFETKGSLPPPMRLLPETALKVASNVINETVVSFAVQSFQKGAVAKYKEYQQQQQQKLRQKQKEEQEKVMPTEVKA